MGPLVQIKGIREGLLVTLGEGEWPELHSSLLEHLTQQREFLRGAKVYLDVGNQILHAIELSELRNEISGNGISLWGVLSNSPVTELTAQTLGLATKLSRQSGRTAYRSVAAADTNLNAGEEAILVRRTLRSGFSIKHAGHVIVIGDVNPGAEIVAGGSIMVWGNLRGTVTAGADGDENAVICALEMSPTQIRIAGVSGNLTKKVGKTSPMMAKLQNGQVEAENWTPAKEKSGGIWPRK